MEPTTAEDSEEFELEEEPEASKEARGLVLTLAEIQNRLDAIQVHLARQPMRPLHDELNSLKGDVSWIAQCLNNTETALADLNEKLTTLPKRIDSLEQKITELPTPNDPLPTLQDQLGQAVQSIEKTQAASLAGLQEEIQTIGQKTAPALELQARTTQAQLASLQVLVQQQSHALAELQQALHGLQSQQAELLKALQTQAQAFQQFVRTTQMQEVQIQTMLREALNKLDQSAKVQQYQMTNANNLPQHFQQLAEQGKALNSRIDALTMTIQGLVTRGTATDEKLRKIEEQARYQSMLFQNQRFQSPNASNAFANSQTIEVLKETAQFREDLAKLVTIVRQIAAAQQAKLSQPAENNAGSSRPARRAKQKPRA